MPEASAASVRCFTQADADPQALQGECIAVLGYGHLGQPFALNLRDSGVSSIVVGNIEDDYAVQARQEGFEVVPLAEATRRADIALVLLPDEVIPEVYAAEVAPNLKAGAAIAFGSGYTLGYGLIQPAADLDVLLLAPRMAGENARQRFQHGQGFYAYVNVEQEASGKAWRRLLGLAAGVGILRAGAVQLTAHQEADLDLLVEQTVGAALGMALMNVFFLGIEAGIPSEAMVLEMYMSEEMENVWRSFREVGLMRASNAHGPTAMYGGFIRTMQLLNSDLPGKFREILQDIQSGAFARQFQAEREAGYPMLAQAQSMAVADHPISQAEERLRKLLGQSMT
jgi:ketol-acid reductoisomerase